MDAARRGGGSQSRNGKDTVGYGTGSRETGASYYLFPPKSQLSLNQMHPPLLPLLVVVFALPTTLLFT